MSISERPSSASSKKLALAILAGGSSVRMGRDKADIVVDDSSMLERIVRAGALSALDVFVVGKIVEGSISQFAVTIPDELPGAGPLAALASALRFCKRELIVVACDMPRVDADAIIWLAEIEIDDRDDGVIVESGGRMEPLFARYRPSCLAYADALLASGERSLRALIRERMFAAVDAPEWMRHRLANVNTPADLELFSRSDRQSGDAA